MYYISHVLNYEGKSKKFTVTQGHTLLSSDGHFVTLVELCKDGVVLGTKAFSNLYMSGLDIFNVVDDRSNLILFNNYCYKLLDYIDSIKFVTYAGHETINDNKTYLNPMMSRVYTVPIGFEVFSEIGALSLLDFFFMYPPKGQINYYWTSEGCMRVKLVDFNKMNRFLSKVRLCTT